MKAVEEAKDTAAVAVASSDDDDTAAEKDRMHRLLDANLKSMQAFADNKYKKNKQFRFDPVVLSFSLVILAKTGRTTYQLLAKAFNLPDYSHVSCITDSPKFFLIYLTVIVFPYSYFTAAQK